jgi:hypothetical protein
MLYHLFCKGKYVFWANKRFLAYFDVIGDCSYACLYQNIGNILALTVNFSFHETRYLISQ